MRPALFHRTWPGARGRVRRLRDWLLASIVALGLWAPFAGAAETAPSGEAAFSTRIGDPHLLLKADLAIVDSAVPPPPGAAWTPVTLPENWRAAARWQQGINGWYRFKLPGGAPPEPQALYLWRFSMNAAVWFNGELIGDGGSFVEPVARHWNRPLLVRLPAPMWRADANELMVRLRVYPGFGHLFPPALGPARLLMPDYEDRLLSQVTLSQVATGVTLLTILAGLALWATDRRSEHAWFVVLASLWLTYSLNNHLRDIPVSAGTWWWLVHSSVDAFYVALFGLLHRLLGVRRPRVEMLVGSAAAVCVVTYAVIDLPQLSRINPVLHGLMSLFGVYAVAWTARHGWRHRDATSAVFVVSFGLVLASGVHDQLLNALVLPVWWSDRYYLAHLTVPVMFLVFLVHLSQRLARGVAAVRQANEALEARVAAAGAEIDRAWGERHVLLAQASAAQERDRIYRDLHDNLGARLLSLVYGARDEQQANLARQALADMRTLIATSQVEGGALAALADDWRVEAELRCEDAGYQLDWSLQGDTPISGRQRYQLERIQRELLSNAIEHSRGKRIEMAWRAGNDLLTLQVRDDGIGCTVEAGQGIDNVKARAADIGGRARWLPGAPSGTCVDVQVPLSPDPLRALPPTAQGA
ncbi:MAG: ATP-binding protein [Aquabacterium sp.]